MANKFETPHERPQEELLGVANECAKELKRDFAEMQEAAKKLFLNSSSAACITFQQRIQSLAGNDKEALELIEHRIPLYFADYWKMRVGLEDQAKNKLIEFGQKKKKLNAEDQADAQGQVDALVNTFKNALHAMGDRMEKLVEHVGLHVIIPVNTLNMKDEHVDILNMHEAGTGPVKRVLRPALYNTKNNITMRAQVWTHSEGKEYEWYDPILPHYPQGAGNGGFSLDDSFTPAVHSPGTGGNGDFSLEENRSSPPPPRRRGAPDDFHLD